MKYFLLLVSCLSVLNISAQNFHYNTLSEMNTTGARAIHPVDLDNDQDLDFIVASYFSDALFWLENLGDLNFQQHTIKLGYSGAYFIEAAYIDDDNHLDLVACAYKDKQVHWLQNDGNQNFTEHLIDDQFDGAFMVLPVDIDDNNTMDIVGAAEVDGTFAIWTNDGNQNFSRQDLDGTNTGATTIYPVNLDGDNDLDLIAAVSGTSEVIWFEQDQGQFIRHTIAQGVGNFRDVAAGDIDGDTDIDVAAVLFDGNGGAIWLENDGNLNFTEHQVNSNVNLNGGWDIHLNDFDQDGDMDILTASYMADEIHLQYFIGRRRNLYRF